MKKIFLALILIAMLPVLYAEVVDKIIARVGNDIILLSELVKQINQMESAGMISEGMRESDILAQMIEGRLIIQKARDLNYTVNNTMIKKEVDDNIKQIKSRFASEEEYVRELRKMKLTNSDLVKYFTDYYTERELTRLFVTNQIASKVMVSDKEMQEFYNAHKDTLAVKPITWNIGMILRQISASEETDNQQLKAIKAIHDRLKSGESFTNLARSESQCPSAEKGGDLGFFSKGMMVKPFEDAAFVLKVGEISDIVKTQYGYHIIKLEEKRNDEIRVRHILKLVQPSAKDSADARQRMESIRQEFLTKNNFSELATKWSMDDDSAKDGGSIGEYGEKDYPELFAPILKSLSLGGISEVLENEGILYLFTKINEVPSRMLSYAEVSKQIKDILFQIKQKQVYDDWIAQLKQENHVEILL